MDAEQGTGEPQTERLTESARHGETSAAAKVPDSAPAAGVEMPGEGGSNRSSPSDELLAAEVVVERDASMHYLQAYGFVFDSPFWLQNVALLSILTAIPLVGLVVLYGYAYEIVEAQHRKPRWTYPAFDFARFGDYLARGMWPFLIVLILLILFVPMFMLLYALALVTALMVIMGVSYVTLTVSIAVPLVMVLGTLVVLLGGMLLRPMFLRAALAQNFGEAFRLPWLRDFVRRVWVELTLATLFSWVSGLAICGLGTSLFFVGILPAIALWWLGSAHLDYQLYQLYLSRGGKPIPLKPPPACFAHLWR